MNIMRNENYCFGGLGCPALYEVVEVTPDEQRCFGGIGCPSVFQLRRLTPEEQSCGVAACPEVYADNKDNYLIVGKVADAKQFGLESKVGKGEVLVSIPRAIIDGMKKE